MKKIKRINQLFLVNIFPFVVLILIFVFGMSAYAIHSSDLVASPLAPGLAAGVVFDADIRCVFLILSGIAFAILGVLLSLRKRDFLR